MAFCEICWSHHTDIELHNQTSIDHLHGHKFECHQCGRWFVSKGARRRHFESTTCIKTPVARTRCWICDTVFQTKKDFTSHEGIHKAEYLAAAATPLTSLVGAAPTAMTPTKSLQDPATPAGGFCELCWNTFPNITLHNKEKKHLAGGTYRCDPCSRWFCSKGARRRHFATGNCVNTPVTAYRCKTCSVLFCTQPEFRSHSRLHKLQLQAESKRIQEVTWCELCWYHYVDIKEHNQGTVHSRGPTHKCTECDRWFSSKAARSRHFESVGCTKKPIVGFPCHDCELVFVAAPALVKHRSIHKKGLEEGVKDSDPEVREDLEVEADKSEGGGKDCSAKAFQTNITSNSSDPPVASTPTMTFCELCWKDFPNIEIHNRSALHLRGQILKCPKCVGRWFSSKKAKHRHLMEGSCLTTTSEFRCCNCDINFTTAKRLKKHLQNKKLHPPREVVALRESDAFCEECNRVFKSPTGLEKHLASVIHNPIMESTKCLGGASCKKSFVTPSGMLAHLESGTCSSKLNRELIDDLVIANDPTNIITDAVAVETRARDRMALTSSEYSASAYGSVMFTPGEGSITYSSSIFEGWSDIHTSTDGSDGTITPRFRRGSVSDSDTNSQSFLFKPVDHPYLQTPSDSGDSGSSIYFTPSESGDSGGGVYLTPSESGDSRSGVYLTPSDTSGSQIFTSTDSLATQLQLATLRCPLCPPTKTKQFKNIGALQTHMRSKAHAAKIYHCPLPIALGNDSGTGKKKKQKSFTTLSGLAQHVEAGACEGGRETFNAAISFVNEKLKGVGMADLKVIGQ